MQKIDIKEIPTSPGIYIFKDEYEEPLYVGKAKNLRKEFHHTLEKIFLENKKTCS